MTIEGQGVVQFYDADGKVMHAPTSMDFYEDELEYPYVRGMSDFYGYFISDGKKYPH